MNRLPEILGIALGGAVGAVSRFPLTGLIATRVGRGFPRGTLAINITGSLMLGFLFAFRHDRLAAESALRGFLMVGLLGAFTTFSTFSLESVQLLLQQELLKLAVYLGTSVGLCVACAWVGVRLGRLL